MSSLKIKTLNNNDMIDAMMFFITIVISIAIIIILVLYYSHKEKMAIIEKGVDVPKALSKSGYSINQILFVAGMFALAIALTGITGSVYSSYVYSIQPNWDFTNGPPPYNKDAGYEIGFFLYSSLCLLFAFYKIRKWNKKERMD